MDKNDIQVYTRQVEDYTIKEFKVVTEINGSLQEIISILRDIDKYKDWMADCRTASILSNDNDKIIYFHFEIDLPFPVQDRDLVQSIEVICIDSTSTEVQIKNHPEMILKNKGITRIPVSRGKWTIDKLGDSRTKVTLQMLSDPGGSLPDWLINAKITGSPFRTMQNLRNQFPPYQ